MQVYRGALRLVRSMVSFYFPLDILSWLTLCIFDSQINLFELWGYSSSISKSSCAVAIAIHEIRLVEDCPSWKPIGSSFWLDAVVVCAWPWSTLWGMVDSNVDVIVISAGFVKNSFKMQELQGHACGSSMKEVANHGMCLEYYNSSFLKLTGAVFCRWKKLTGSLWHIAIQSKSCLQKVVALAYQQGHPCSE